MSGIGGAGAAVIAAGGREGAAEGPPGRLRGSVALPGAVGAMDDMRVELDEGESRGAARPASCSLEAQEERLYRWSSSEFTYTCTKITSLLYSTSFPLLLDPSFLAKGCDRCLAHFTVHVTSGVILVPEAGESTNFVNKNGPDETIVAIERPREQSARRTCISVDLNRR